MSIARLYDIFLKSAGICTDSRKTIPGSVFFAMKGENYDGNKFAADALLNGCIHAVVDDPSLVENENFTRVNNVLETLQKLAACHRNHLKIPIIAITGSNGKTTTKELCSVILGKKFNVLSTQGNLNNHIGVPLTLLSIKNEELAIIEMGANHEGEIKTLCSIALPTFGLITNIGLAHLEGFKSPEGIRRGKGELYDFLKDNKGHVFYNAESGLLTEMIRQKQVDSIPYGDHPMSICNGKINGNHRFLIVQLQFKDEQVNIHTNLVGEYNLENIVAAAAVGSYFGVPVHDIKQAVEGYRPSNARSQYINTGKNKVILDAYNANPSSMKSSILNFCKIRDHMKKVLILGDMLELGEFEDEEHLSILDLVTENDFHEVFLVGPRFSKLNAHKTYKCFDKAESLIKYFNKHSITDRMILIKGSRGLKLEKILVTL